MRFHVNVKWQEDLLIGVLMCKAMVENEGEVVMIGRLISIGFLFLHINISILEEVGEGE